MRQFGFLLFLFTILHFVAIAQIQTAPAPPIGEPVDRYGKESTGREKARLDNFSISLFENRGAEAFVAVSFTKKHGRKYADARIRKILTYLGSRDVDATKISFAVFEDNYEQVELWIVPPGAELPPMPKAYDLIKGEELIPKSSPKPRRKKLLANRKFSRR